MSEKRGQGKLKKRFNSLGYLSTKRQLSRNVAHSFRFNHPQNFHAVIVFLLHESRDVSMFSDRRL